MKSITRFAKRALSLVLCLTVVMTTVLFFDIGIIKSEAKVSTVPDITNSAAQADVLFYVPEAIYLRPVSYSWVSGSKSKFHFFVENNVLDGSGNLMSQPQTQTGITTGNGKIYFKYANATNVDVEIRYLKTDMSGSYNDGGALSLLNKQGSSSGPKGIYWEINREMESPTLAATDTGCILEWRLKYHDTTDNLDKIVVAYSYVYKPYVVPISTGIMARELFHNDHEVQHISWLSGFHEVVSQSTNKAGESNDCYYARYGASANSGQKGLMPFLTHGNLDGINGSGAVGYKFQLKTGDSANPAGKAMLNAYFASENTNYDYFWAEQPGHVNTKHGTFNEFEATDWHVEEGVLDASGAQNGNSAFNKKTHTYSKTDTDTGGNATSDDSYVWKSRVNTAVGGIYIDTSRYKDLYQVPNLGIGLMITESTGAEKGAWKVTDYSTRTQKDIGGSVNINLYGGTYNDGGALSGEAKLIWDDCDYAIASVGTLENLHDEGAFCGVKYAGTWPRVLNSTTSESSTQTYKIKMTTMGYSGGDMTVGASIMNLQAKQYDKSSLRTAVNNAIKVFARLGVSDINSSNANEFVSHYFENTGAYKTFVDAYKEAYTALIALDKNPGNISDHVKKLNDAINAINTDTKSRKTSGANQYHIGVLKNSDGETYRIVELPGTTHYYTEYKFGNKVEFTAETFENCKFLGAIKLVADIGSNGATSLVHDSYNLEKLPEFIADGHKDDHDAKQEEIKDEITGEIIKKVTTFPHKEPTNPRPSTEIATVDAAGSTITYPYMAEHNVTYCYFYEVMTSEVRFGNEFDFDATRWHKPPETAKQRVDFVNNTVTLESLSGSVYTETGIIANQPNYMNLMPGRTYRFSLKYENLSDEPAPIHALGYTWARTTDTSYGAQGCAKVEKAVIAGAKGSANATGSISGTITVPSVAADGHDSPYATIRIGIADYDGVSATGKKVMFSDICIRDISTYYTKEENGKTVFGTNTIYLAGDSTQDFTKIPLETTGNPEATVEVNYENGTAPKIARSGYQFAGWSEDRLETGNGGTPVTTTTLPAYGSKMLYPIWRVNVTYNVNNGQYRKSDDPLDRNNYIAEGRWNLDPCTDVAVSNRIKYNRTNELEGWNSTDLDLSYVPFKEGYNFDGWEVSGSIDPKIQGQVFWPGEYVPAEANVEFKARWTEATEIDTSPQTIVSTHNGKADKPETQATVYPGQIVFYCFTPTERDMYVSAYTFNNGEADTEINWLKNNGDLSENDNASEHAAVAELQGKTFEYFGLTTAGIGFDETKDSLLTAQLNQNEKTYLGVALHHCHISSKDELHFRMQEHKVIYELNPKGGTFDGDANNQFIEGYGGVDTELLTNVDLYGYVLAGWKTAEGEEIQKEYSVSGGQCIVPGEDNTAFLAGYTKSFEKPLKLEAVWVYDKFTLVYDGNKRENESTTPKDLPADQELTYNVGSNIPENNPPTRDGYTFKGWALTSEKIENETLYTSELPADIVNVLYAEMKSSGSAYARLYARWAPNIIIVRFKNDVNTAETHTQKFFFDQEQKLDEVKFTAQPFTVNFYNVNPETNEASFYKSGVADRAIDGWQSEANVINPETGSPYYYQYGSMVKNPNGVFGYSDQEEGAMETILFTDWSKTKAFIETPILVNDNSKYILAGWALEEDKSTVVALAGDKFEATYEGQNLYAVWYSKDKADALEDDIIKYQKPFEIVSGIVITDADLTIEESYEKITAGTVQEYDTTRYQSLIDSYVAAQKMFEDVKNGDDSAAKIAANNALLNAIRDLEAVTEPQKTRINKEYLSKFKIEYADSVPESERTVSEGEYSLADVNLNHYAVETLTAAKDTFESANAFSVASEQNEINKIVVTLARAYASKEDVKESTPVYNVYDTVASLKNSGISYSEDIEAMSYVYTGKGNYTYYCYTNSMNPTLYLVVDEISEIDNRICFPTTATPYGDRIGTGGADPVKPEITQMTDLKALTKYKSYLNAGIGTTPVLSVDDNGNKVQGTSEYYSNKALIKLTPDFTDVPQSVTNATVEYTFKAYDDAYAGPENKDINYADAANLVSGAEKGKLSDIPQGEKATNKSDGKVVTQENTITIKIDYHVSDTNGNKLSVSGDQTAEDVWLTQFHLYRSSGGASNWDLPMPGDAVYKVNDPTFGQKDYGSFTYTFTVGDENDFANSVLTSADVEDVKRIVKENYTAIQSDTFIGRQKDKNAGLGYLAWKNTTWSFNYYPKSNAYTYVHLIDRWGNVVDEVIQVPNLDGTATTLTAQGVGDVVAVEAGGSGIDTMSISAQTFDIITDECSTFDGTTYTTTGNTIKIYTGEANKKYNLTVNDVATNKTTGTATTDADGYLTITVEDVEFDTQSGDMYTFTLNGTTINLYAESDRVILSADDVVGENKAATVSITTTAEATMVQLVSASGTTATATEYTEDENGNRVWQIDVKKNPGSYEYEVKAKVDGKWISENKTVTVTIKEPTIFVGAVTAVEYTPSTDTRNEFMFTVTGRADKVQVIEPDGGTRTYDRYHAKVVIVSYDEEGNVIGSMSRELSYEVWTIEMNVPADIELTAIARYGRQWSTDAPYVYTVTLLKKELDDEVYSMELASTEGKQGKVQATVITGLDVSGVRFVMDNDTTTTYYNSTEADGRLTYIGNAWMNHSGENIIIVKIRVKNAWLNAGELTYQAI